jgi:hypothetical protein
MTQHQMTIHDDKPKSSVRSGGLLSFLLALFAHQEGTQLRERIPQTLSLSYHPVISGIELLRMLALPHFSPLLKRKVCVRVF